jgi:DNA-binding GntR family transcriptional regulator
MNDRIATARTPDRIIDLDDAWHLALIAGCPNKVLLELIRQFMQRTRRYELALMRSSTNVNATCASHRAVLSAVRRRDLDAACEALRANLANGYQPIATWLTREQRASG